MFIDLINKIKRIIIEIQLQSDAGVAMRRAQKFIKEEEAEGHLVDRYEQFDHDGVIGITIAKGSKHFWSESPEMAVSIAAARAAIAFDEECRKRGERFSVCGELNVRTVS